MGRSGLNVGIILSSLFSFCDSSRQLGFGCGQSRFQGSLLRFQRIDFLSQVVDLLIHQFIKIRRIGRNLPLQATDVIIVVLARSRYACRCRKKRTKQSHTDKLSLHNQIKLVKTYNSLLSLLPLINFYLYARGGNSIP